MLRVFKNFKLKRGRRIAKRKGARGIPSVDTINAIFSAAFDPRIVARAIEAAHLFGEGSVVAGFQEGASEKIGSQETVKVADLIDDLEQGDRTMEHVAKGDSGEMSPEDFRTAALAEQLSRIAQGSALRGSPFGGLGGQLGQAQGYLNSLANQQMQNAQMAMNSMMGPGYMSYGSFTSSNTK